MFKTQYIHGDGDGEREREKKIYIDTYIIILCKYKGETRFPVDFPLNQSSDTRPFLEKPSARSFILFFCSAQEAGLLCEFLATMGKAMFVSHQWVSHLALLRWVSLVAVIPLEAVLVREAYSHYIHQCQYRIPMDPSTFLGSVWGMI